MAEVVSPTESNINSSSDGYEEYTEYHEDDFDRGNEDGFDQEYYGEEYYQEYEEESDEEQHYTESYDREDYSKDYRQDYRQDYSKENRTENVADGIVGESEQYTEYNGLSLIDSKLEISIIVFNNTLEGSKINVMSFAKYFYVRDLNVPAYMKKKKITIDDSCDLYPSSIMSMVYIRNIRGLPPLKICRGIVHSDSKVFRCNSTIETKMIGYNNQILTLKISSESIHVTGSKNSKQDSLCIQKLVDQTNRTDRVIRKFGVRNKLTDRSINWFLKNMKCEPIEYEENGVIYSRTLRKYPIEEPTPDLDNDILEYLLHLSGEFDDYVIFVDYISDLLAGTSLTEGERQCYIKSRNIISRSGWLKMPWKPIPCKTAQVFENIKGFTVNYEPTINSFLSLIYTDETYDSDGYSAIFDYNINDNPKLNKVKFTVKISSVLIAGKSEKLLNYCANLYTKILEDNKDELKIEC